MAGLLCETRWSQQLGAPSNVLATKRGGLYSHVRAKLGTARGVCMPRRRASLEAEFRPNQLPPSRRYRLE